MPLEQVQLPLADKAPRRGWNRPGHGTEEVTSMQAEGIPHGYCQCGCGGKAPLVKSNHPARGYVKGEPHRFIVGHNNRRPLRVRFFEKVDKTDECWYWTAFTDKDGYGTICTDAGHRRAHRVSYELFVGPIPDGLTIDHACHTNDDTCPGGPACPHRRCVNPAHLEPLASGENVLRGKTRAAANKRKTHCPHGHPYDEENTYIDRKGSRSCLECRRTAAREYQRRRRAA